MSGNNFRFKRFTIEQDGCAMKVGTDGVLLGAWCRVRPQDKLMLDIGTGSGVIALQLAQRTEATGARIEAVETDAASADCASRNFAASAWGSRLKIHEMSAQKFAETSACGILPTSSYSARPSATVDVQSVGSRQIGARFDHIVSNPPYFIDSLASPDPQRNNARHTDSLSYNELIVACDKLLKPDGLISLILPTVEAEKMSDIAAAHGFGISRRTEVWSTPKSGPKRILLEFSRNNTTEPELSSLVIQGSETGSFSEEYRVLTRNFYLYL